VIKERPIPDEPLHKPQREPATRKAAPAAEFGPASLQPGFVSFGRPPQPLGLHAAGPVQLAHLPEDNGQFIMRQEQPPHFLVGHQPGQDRKHFCQVPGEPELSFAWLVGVRHTGTQAHGTPLPQPRKLRSQALRQIRPRDDVPFEVPFHVVFLGPSVAVGTAVPTASVGGTGV
jgi:hypothetical protein